MREFNKKIIEKIEELADGRIHQYEEVENIINWVEWASRKDERMKIINNIRRNK